jgi:hypothetical protein
MLDKTRSHNRSELIARVLGLKSTPPASPTMRVQSFAKSATLGLDQGGVALERPQCATALELSHLERLVSGGGNGVSAVWSHRHGVDLTSVALEGSQCAASLQLPPPRSLVGLAD